MTNARWVYDFAQGSREMRELLGGKGANVTEMTRVLGAGRVPAGFTITTEACVAYLRCGAVRDGLAAEVDEALARLERQVGRRSATQRTRCWYRCARAHASRGRGCSTRCLTWG